MKLEEIEIRNFRSLNHNNLINFQNLNFLLGKNNTGKSNFIKNLGVLSNNKSVEKQDISINSKKRTIKTRATFTFSDEEIESLVKNLISGIFLVNQSDEVSKLVKNFITIIPKKIIYEIKREYFGDNMTSQNIIYFNDIKGEITSILSQAFDNIQNTNLLNQIKGTIEGIITANIQQKFYFLEPIRNPMVISQPTEVYRMDSSAHNLIELIYTARNNDTPEFSEFIHNMKKIIPEIKNIITPPTENKVTVGIKEEGISGNIHFNLSQLSSGLIETMSIIATITLSPKGSIICIEEPEIHLHPHAIRALQELLREKSKDKQLFISTHSVFLTEKGEVNEILFFTRDKGMTNVKQLQEENDIEEVNKEMGYFR